MLRWSIDNSQLDSWQPNESLRSQAPASCAEIAGTVAPKKIDELSIVPTLLGQPDKQQQHNYLYWEFTQNQAIRTGKYFAHRKNGGAVELYDLSNDPQQETDVASAHPELSKKILNWMIESHRPSEVWPSPGETKAAFEQRLKDLGVPARPNNIDG